jgi:Rrf2 family protein
MIKVSKKSQYGLRAMICLAQNYKLKRVISIKKISEKEGIPFGFLEKIVSRLEKSGLVRGKKGVNGGYILARSPQKISVGDIVFVLEENKKPVNCALCGKKAKCASRNVWIKLDLALNKALESIKLSSLIR